MHMNNMAYWTVLNLYLLKTYGILAISLEFMQAHYQYCNSPSHHSKYNIDTVAEF